MNHKEKVQPISVVFICKGGFYLVNTYFALFVDVEMKFNSSTEFYCRSIDVDNLIDEIATKALHETGILENNLPLDSRIFKNISVEADDVIDNRKIDEAWLKHNPEYNYYKILDSQVINVEYEGIYYTCSVELMRSWFDDEERVNNF